MIRGNALPPGVKGDLVATVLVNRAMPLLRYRTGDRGTLLAESLSLRLRARRCWAS